ncbi:aminotransferase class V-fold PLP-dependent enzyme [Rubinisphaera brasiliensis]|uniref:Cysteine desulfurase n=1 Tax=Rubinisphaera brasiliensis (strain ATCC 49424 / DSM 5305 / JCM 21570 / IAM 15109 / NBRC 103401 / IFAM 1448) TaxID=756272 RepID=F0SI95_RUBBR|nr:SufS family cysteine desulfurase [Rubinisphaera brasiliensis]ADY58484.1 cysteine desulfurase, SufS subfamily [Rubinisphaera brasiliensis DSM 5305]
MSTAATSLDLTAIRAQFPILQQPDPRGRPVIYLDNGASAQKPQRVIDKEIEVYSCHYANAYRGVYEFGQIVDDSVEATRQTVRDLIGAESQEEIVFTSGTTMSLNLVASCWGRHTLKPGDEILLTEMEHHANIVPWQMIAEQTGAVVRYIPLTSDYRLDLSDLPGLITERTKIVAVTGMSNVLGTLVDPRPLADAVHQVGGVLVVDAAQSILHQQHHVVNDCIDFLTFSGHKIYGPSGVGVLYGKREHLEAMPPFLGGGHMIERVFPDHSTWSPPPAKFEAGTLPIAQAIALKPAIEFVQELGYASIQAHEHDLLVKATEQLSEVPGLKIYGPGLDHKGAIVTFTLEGAHPQDLAFLLNKKGVCVRHGHHCTMPLHDKLGLTATVRASFGVYNTAEEVDQLTDALHYARKRLRLS